MAPDSKPSAEARALCQCPGSVDARKLGGNVTHLNPSSKQRDQTPGSWYRLCIRAAPAEETAPEPLAQQEIKFYPQFALFSTNPARAGT